MSAVAAENPDLGGLTVAIADHRVDIAMTGGGMWEIPLGPVTLCDNELQRDPPRPAELTNALGFVHDYFDDIIVAAPTVLATPSVMAIGHHAAARTDGAQPAVCLPHDLCLRCPRPFLAIRLDHCEAHALPAFEKSADGQYGRRLG